MKSLLFFSGGMDSTYVLYKLLTETDDEVTAVHLRRGADYPLFIGLLEKDVPNLQKLVDELQKIRKFKFVIHELVETTNELSHWYTQAMHYATPLLNSGDADRMITGRTWEQRDQKPFKGSDFLGLPSDLAVQRMWERDVKRGEKWDPLENHYYHKQFSRAHAISELPENLQKLTISCHYPTVEDNEVKNCGLCHRCLWDEKVRSFVADGWNTDQINLWRHMKSLQYGGGGGITAPMRAWLPVEMGKGYWRGLDTKAKVMAFCQTREHYSLTTGRKPEGIWATETSDQSTT